ncbi:hypothetical protein ATE92_0899 [Ulvibacter sp. MAR_2010_11]|uniref:hypothetical protein n=1 Tax=Ulvibacter sp. MAR_2010_11 TaxID=1250229 RepID=UPI000C2C26A2|nr:hypothetical protein [Ulvibacter sp. MAR_2010_11]PKA82762.1 hypothetical protein ATE92_0899 [Ulvibacter sp. MAR_2010_11]
MNNLSPKTSVSLLGVLCATVGHHYKVTRKVTNHINEYKCTHCGREVTDNQSGKLETLTQKIKEVNTNVAEFFQKRTNRIPIQ